MTVVTHSPRVAVIGAGISGVVTAAHLKSADVEVKVFERANASGGVWIYDERPPLEPKYPAIIPSQAEDLGTKIDGNDFSALELQHAPTSPCYDGLRNNVGTRMMKTTLNSWPEGTPDFTTHDVLKDYIQETSRRTGVEEITKYGARVSNMRKENGQWQLSYSTLDTKDGQLQEQRSVETFDAVVVASGHYHAPRVPDLAGLKEWKAQFPSRVFHSKAYRSTRGFEGKNILLIGAGTSSTDIARDLGPIAKTIYQSSRNGLFDLTAAMLPENAIRIGEIASLDAIRIDEKFESVLQDDEPLPSTVTLKSGQKLCNIHTVIICTGYHFTLPFLSQYHEDNTVAKEASGEVLVTDGTQVHNLHKDIWYIPDPSLIFVGIPFFTATFSLFDFQAIAVAAVLSGKANLPSQEAMRKEYKGRVEAKGYGRFFHSLLGKDVEYVDELLDWVNEDGKKIGREKIEGHSKEWHQAKVEHMERVQALFGGTRLLGGGEDLSGTILDLPVCT